MKKRIAFVIGSLAVGGAERQMALLASRLVERGWDVTVFAFDGEGPLRQVLREAGVAIVDGGYRFSAVRARRFVLFAVLFAIRLLVFLAFRRPRVVHGYLPLTNFLAALSGCLAFIPVIVTSKRALGKHQDKRPIFGRIDRIANALSSVVTANSCAVAQDVEQRDGYPSEKIAVIRNGIDLECDWGDPALREKMRRQLKLAENDTAIIQVANLIPYKGHAELLEATAIVFQTEPNVHLFLAGEDRGLGKDLLEQARLLGVENHVHFLGGRSDIAPLLSAADIGVLASHEEGSSNALIEKLAAGLPVVATRVGGNIEALEDMPGCALVEAKDGQALAQGLLRIMLNSKNPADTSKRVQTISARHAIPTMVNSYTELYECHVG